MTMSSYVVIFYIIYSERGVKEAAEPPLPPAAGTEQRRQSGIPATHTPEEQRRHPPGRCHFGRQDSAAAFHHSSRQGSILLDAPAP
jgi:hypothetical protein